MTYNPTCNSTPWKMDNNYLGIQLGVVLSTSQVENNLMGIGLLEFMLMRYNLQNNYRNRHDQLL